MNTCTERNFGVPFSSRKLFESRFVNNEMILCAYNFKRSYPVVIVNLLDTRTKNNVSTSRKRRA